MLQYVGHQILWSKLVLYLLICLSCGDVYMFMCIRKAKMLVSKVIEDAGGATNMPVSIFIIQTLSSTHVV